MLIEEGVKSKEQIVNDLQLAYGDIENLIEERGYIKNVDRPKRPVLKTIGNKVIPFPQR